MNELPAPDSAKYVRRELEGAAPEFYRRLAEDGGPSTTRCPRCDVTAFPPRLTCPTCGEPQEWVALPREGTLHAFTTQERALRFAAPVVLAVVELGEVTVPGILEAEYETLEIGMPVRVSTRIEPDTRLTVISFEPAT